MDTAQLQPGHAPVSRSLSRRTANHILLSRGHGTPTNQERPGRGFYGHLRRTASCLPRDRLTVEGLRRHFKEKLIEPYVFKQEETSTLAHVVMGLLISAHSNATAVGLVRV